MNAESFTLLNIIDFAFICSAVYVFYYIFRKAQIQNLLPVTLVFICSYSVSKMIGLHMFSWLIERAFVVFVIFIFIIFQNEIRRASEKIRRGKLFLDATIFWSHIEV